MEKITVIDYLVKELQKLGVEDFFGLPGDYNFNILDAIIANPETNWIGCTNELNAGYAADGYARITITPFSGCFQMLSAPVLFWISIMQKMKSTGFFR